MLNAKGKTRNVIFITFDGLRWQEVFYGADSLLINNDEYTKERNQILEDYWADTPQTRREKLMPFFWSTINTEGQLYGNVRERAEGWCSYTCEPSRVFISWFQ